MEGKVVFEGLSKTGDKLLIRYPKKHDLDALLAYINALSKEQTYIRYQGEEITLEEETQYLTSQLKRIEQKQSVQLLVFSGGELIGNTSIDLFDKTESHKGLLGISIAKEYRGKGMGKLLMQHILDEAKNLPRLHIVTMAVYAVNTLAIEMYKKFGFVEYGRLPNGVHYRGNFIDEILMYKPVR